MLKIINRKLYMTFRVGHYWQIIFLNNILTFYLRNIPENSKNKCLRGHLNV